ncbi:MAG: methylaspartate ammonia-lyase [Acholeplasmataceae bacterium]|nr:MAG: methylaspartate ammonia-lyase [Acholeplasmataceae bacterium]
MIIKDVLFTKSYTGFYFDDQRAIKKDAANNGFMYAGDPITPGFIKVRQPGEAISIQLVLENGAIATGDCASVQYSGAGGRDPLFLADDYIPWLEQHIKPCLLDDTITTFKSMAERYDMMKFDGKRMHTAIRYGLTQALLHAVALAQNLTMAEVIRNEYNPSLTTIKSIPIFAQTGDDRYTNVDKMILKEVDTLPHALINNVKDKLGQHGEILLGYVKWIRERIMRHRARADYLPVIHIDVYGTIGLAFDNDLERIVDYLKTLEDAAKPFKIRIEGPIDAGEREGTMMALRNIRKMVDERGIDVGIVADEWCNNLADIKYFADHQAGHMLQIKTPDLGGVHHIAEAILYCREKGIGAYCGGTCNETNISAQVTTQIAMACEADVCLAKPGMDVDGGFMIVKNEMMRIIALASTRKGVKP